MNADRLKNQSNPIAPFRFVSPRMILLTLLWLIIYIFCFPDPAELASKNWPLILVGIAGAIIGNMTAIGGGLIFIPVLIFGYQLGAVAALKLAFVTQAAGMTSGAVGWFRRHEVPVELLKWTIPSLIIGTAISTFVLHPNAVFVKTLFGPVSLLAGIMILLTIDKQGTLDSLPRRALLPVFIISILGGLITGWVAIGEGEIIAAFCMLVYKLRPQRAIGLGVVLLSVNSILLALVHGLYFGGVPWEMAIFTILGVLWGGRLGPYISHWISVQRTKKIFAWIAMLDGLLMTWQALRP